jgi:hypothetical protein
MESSAPHTARLPQIQTLSFSRQIRKHLRALGSFDTGETNGRVEGAISSSGCKRAVLRSDKPDKRLLQPTVTAISKAASAAIWKV